jgi:Uma2 family endonuclease
VLQYLHLPRSLPMHESTALLEPDDLLHLQDGDSYELVDGHLQEKRVGARSEEIAGSTLAALHRHVRSQKLGHVFGSNTSYRCFPDRPRLLRKPDASVVLRGRFSNEETPAGDIAIPPDIAVEVVSPNDTYEEVERKVVEYLAANVRLIWVLSPESKTVLIRRPNKTCTALDITDTLTGEDVLPGFSCPVAELFA